MRVVVTAAALQDLAEIGAYIARDNPERAVSFIDELLEHCERLGAQPLRNPLVPRYKAHGIRRCVHANYLIFYRVGLKQIEVIHVFQGAREYEPLLFPDDLSRT